MFSESDLAARLAPHHLEVLGGFAAETRDHLPDGTRALLILGPAEPGFWPHLTAEPEWQDGAPDPMDRWSVRVIDALAADLGGRALYPFGGPPYHPFYAWMLRTGRAWASPVQPLVHATQGMMVSIRGALALPFVPALPPAVPRPCDTCTAPCLTTCPAGAMGTEGYAVATCRSFLHAGKGEDCLSGGCLVRRACPVSQGYARMPEQSAYHMRLFHR